MTDDTILDEPEAPEAPPEPEATPEDEAPEPMPGNAPAPAPDEDHGATDDPESDIGAGTAGAKGGEVPSDAF